MNFRILATDSLRKLIVLATLAIWSRSSSHDSLDRSITLFFLSSLPNTLITGIPSLRACTVTPPAPSSGTSWSSSSSIVVPASFISEQFPDTVGSIISSRVDSDVIFLNDQESPQTDATVENDGKLHLTSAEIYSLQSSRNPTTMGSSFNHTNFSLLVNGARKRKPSTVQLHEEQ